MARYTSFMATQLGFGFAVVDTYRELFRDNLQLLREVNERDLLTLIDILETRHADEQGSVTHSLTLSLSSLFSLSVLPSFSLFKTKILILILDSLSCLSTFGFGHVPFNLTLTHSHTLLITCTCCDDQIKGTQDKDFSYSFSDSLSCLSSLFSLLLVFVLQNLWQELWFVLQEFR